MPEFAEVNLQVKWLRERVTGWEINSYGTSAWSHFPALKDDPQKDEILGRFFEGASINSVTQRGKFVVFRLSSGTMISHLMFKGRWSLEGEDFISNYKQHKKKPTEKSNNFWVISSSGRLNFHEPEYKGKVHAFPTKIPGSVEELTRIGPEIISTPETDPDFADNPWTLSDFQKNISKTRRSIKEFLLDQKKQAGLGNMYVCEALYQAKINPARAANTITESESKTLFQAAKDVVNKAIETKLDYDKVLLVYRKETDPEGNPVETTKVGGRDTFWVPAVQS